MVITRRLILEVAAEIGGTERTVLRVLAGVRGHRSATRQVTEALARRGIVVAPTSGEC